MIGGMQHDTSAGSRNVRYEPDDKPPLALTAGLGLQFAILSIAGIVLTPAIVIRAAGESDSYLTWAVFAAAAVSGVSTILAAARGENIEDRLAVLDEPTATRPVERDISLRLLQHFATSVVHQQYHELEIVTVHVNTPPPPDPAGEPAEQ